MIETILLARKHKTGEQVVLLGSDKHFSEQKAALDKFVGDSHEEYDRVGLYQLVPQKRVLKLSTKVDADKDAARIKKHNKIQADAESGIKLEPEKI
jgi:hypothetical protein